VNKPIVDRLESDLKGKADVLRIDLMSGVGRESARKYGVTFIPALLLFDGEGNLLLHQQGSLDAGAIRTEVEGLYRR
jgi:thioredoxin-related protein